MKNVTVSLDDDIYRNAKRRAAENDRSLSSVVREALSTYGAEESEFDRLKRARHELLAEWRKEGIGLDASENLTREEIYDRHHARRENPDAYR